MLNEQESTQGLDGETFMSAPQVQRGQILVEAKFEILNARRKRVSI